MNGSLCNKNQVDFNYKWLKRLPINLPSLVSGFFLITMTSVNRFCWCSRKINLHSFRDLRWWIFPERKSFTHVLLRCLRQLCENGNRLNKFVKMRMLFIKNFHLWWIKYLMIRAVLMSTDVKKESLLLRTDQIPRRLLHFKTDCPSKALTLNLYRFLFFENVPGCHSSVLLFRVPNCWTIDSEKV